LNMKAAQGRW